jgi:hypothetical protein
MSRKVGTKKLLQVIAWEGGHLLPPYHGERKNTLLCGGDAEVLDGVVQEAELLPGPPLLARLLALPLRLPARGQEAVQILVAQPAHLLRSWGMYMRPGCSIKLLALAKPNMDWCQNKSRPTKLKRRNGIEKWKKFADLGTSMSGGPDIAEDNRVATAAYGMKPLTPPIFIEVCGGVSACDKGVISHL